MRRVVDYSVLTNRNVISAKQAALVMMFDWPEPLFLSGYSRTEWHSDVQTRCSGLKRCNEFWDLSIFIFKALSKILEVSKP